MVARARLNCGSYFRGVLWVRRRRRWWGLMRISSLRSRKRQGGESLRRPRRRRRMSGPLGWKWRMTTSSRARQRRHALSAATLRGTKQLSRIMLRAILTINRNLNGSFYLPVFHRHPPPLRPRGSTLSGAKPGWRAVYWGLNSQNSFPLPIAAGLLKGSAIPTVARLLPGHSLPSLMGQCRGTSDQPPGTPCNLVSSVLPHEILQGDRILTAQLLQDTKKKLRVYVGLRMVVTVTVEHNGWVLRPPASWARDARSFMRFSATGSTLLAPAVANKFFLKKPVSSLSSILPKPFRIRPH